MRSFTSYIFSLILLAGVLSKNIRMERLRHLQIRHDIVYITFIQFSFASHLFHLPKRKSEWNIEIAHIINTSIRY